MQSAASSRLGCPCPSSARHQRRRYRRHKTHRRGGSRRLRRPSRGRPKGVEWRVRREYRVRGLHSRREIVLYPLPKEGGDMGYLLDKLSVNLRLYPCPPISARVCLRFRGHGNVLSNLRLFPRLGVQTPEKRSGPGKSRQWRPGEPSGRGA